jgi:hypothetical protein
MKPVLDCELGDSLVHSNYDIKWKVKGLNTLNGDLYVESEGESGLRYKTVTAETAEFWQVVRRV